MEPFRFERSRNCALTCVDNTVRFEADFQAVGFDGFDTKSFVKRCSTHFYISLPHTCFSHRVGRNGEGVEAVLVVGFHLTLVKLPFGREYFE